MIKDIFTGFNVPVIVGVTKGHSDSESNKKNTEDHSGYGEKLVTFFEHGHQLLSAAI